jgi:hypothetical protein
MASTSARIRADVDAILAATKDSSVIGTTATVFGLMSDS